MGVDIRIPGTFSNPDGLPVLGPPVGAPYLTRWGAERIPGAVGSLVDVWMNETGTHGFHANQPSHRPTLETVDGHRVLRFDGTTRISTTQSGSLRALGLVASFAVVFRLNSGTTPAGVANWYNDTESPAPSDGWMRLAMSGQVNVEAMGIDESIQSTGSSYGTGWVACAVDNVNAPSISVNGEDAVTATGQVAYGSITNMFVGRDADLGVGSGAVDIAEVVLFEGASTLAQLKAVSGTLAARYNG